MITPISALQSGLTTVRRGTDRLDAAAAVASTAFLPMEDRAPTDANDLVGALVEMMLAKHQVAIGARVIERASATEKEVLDLLV